MLCGGRPARKGKNGAATSLVGLSTPHRYIRAHKYDRSVNPCPFFLQAPFQVKIERHACVHRPNVIELAACVIVCRYITTYSYVYRVRFVVFLACLYDIFWKMSYPMTSLRAKVKFAGSNGPPSTLPWHL